jgi:hypothetical protein
VVALSIYRRFQPPTPHPPRSPGALEAGPPLKAPSIPRKRSDTALFGMILVTNHGQAQRSPATVLVLSYTHL